MNTKITAVVMPRLDLGQHHAPDSLEMRRAEIHRCVKLPPVEPVQRCEQRQCREREIEVGKHEDDRRPVVQQPGRRAEPEHAEQTGDGAFVAQI